MRNSTYGACVISATNCRKSARAVAFFALHRCRKRFGNKTLIDSALHRE